MHFFKLQGAGNDYIFVDCFDIKVDNMSELAKTMSNRHFGIGGDGVVFLYPSLIADVRMRMFNADGSEGETCGNAVRCIARLLSERYQKNEFTVETNSGVRTVFYDQNTDTFRVDMGEPIFSEEVNKPLFVCGRQYLYTYISMGNPHCVIFVSDVSRININDGEAIQSHSFFPDGINVEFVQIQGLSLKVRVFERGSGETLSCGTGACAAVAACVKLGLLKKGLDVKVSLLGGELTVNYSGNIFLTGMAEKVYEGDYYDKVHFCNGRCCKRTR